MDLKREIKHKITVIFDTTFPKGCKSLTQSFLNSCKIFGTTFLKGCKGCKGFRKK